MTSGLGISADTSRVQGRRSKGAIEVNGVPVKTGDGAAIQSEQLLNVKGIEQAEVVLVDVA